jgi:hypothetical protein
MVATEPYPGQQKSPMLPQALSLFIGYAARMTARYTSDIRGGIGITTPSGPSVPGRPLPSAGDPRRLFCLDRAHRYGPAGGHREEERRHRPNDAGCSALAPRCSRLRRPCRCLPWVAVSYDRCNTQLAAGQEECCERCEGHGSATRMLRRPLTWVRWQKGESLRAGSHVTDGMEPSTSNRTRGKRGIGTVSRTSVLQPWISLLNIESFCSGVCETEHPRKRRI